MTKVIFDKLKKKNKLRSSDYLLHLQYPLLLFLRFFFKFSRSLPPTLEFWKNEIAVRNISAILLQLLHFNSVTFERMESPRTTPLALFSWNFNITTLTFDGTKLPSIIRSFTFLSVTPPYFINGRQNWATIKIIIIYRW